MSRDLTLEIQINDLVYHTVFFGTKLPAWHDKSKTATHVVHKVAGFVKKVKPSYVIIFCPYYRYDMRIQRSEITDVIESRDDRRSAHFINIPLYEPPSLIISAPKEIITHKKGIIRL